MGYCRCVQFGVIVFIGMLIIGGCGFPRATLVNFSGSDLNRHILYIGGSGPGNYSTIQDAVYVAWTTTFSGGLMLIPQERHYQGAIEEFTPGAEVVVQQQTMAGFGRIDVTVTAGPAAAMRR